MNLKKRAASLAIATTAFAMGAAHAVPVALELAVVIDVSGSVNATEYILQRDGYEAAFQNPAVGTAIASHAGSGGVAVGVYFFAENSLSMIGWTQLDSAADAFAFGTSIGALARPAQSANDGFGALGAATNIAEGIDRAVLGLGSNGFEGTRSVIDVSGDGRQNTARTGGALPGCTFGGDGTQAACLPPIDGASGDAELAGIVVNGLAILNDFPTLDDYYADHVITAGGFVLSATFDTFASAVQTKIGRELIPVPEPATLALLGIALAGLGFSRHKLH